MVGLQHPKNKVPQVKVPNECFDVHLCNCSRHFQLTKNPQKLTRPGMEQLEGQVHLQLPPHPAEVDLDLGRVGDDDAEEVVGVAGLGQGGGGQVGLVADLKRIE